MRKFLVFAFLMSFCSAVSSQPIIAGQYSTDDYYKDIKDTTLLMTGQWSGSPPYLIDINGDGITDFDICIARSGGLGGGYSAVYIGSPNWSEMAIEKLDSCWGTMQNTTFFWGTDRVVKSFSAGDTIDDGAFSLTEYILQHPKKYSGANFLAYYSWTMVNGACWNSSFSAQGPLYIGVRTFSGRYDTTYGWIRVSGVWDEPPTVTIHDYASRKLPIIFPEEPVTPKELILGIFPSPSNGRFIVGTSIDSGTISIVDVLGREVLHQSIESNSSVIDISDQAQGIYIVSVATESGTEHKKIVLKRD